MRTHKPYYFNAYKLIRNFSFLTISGFGLACGGQNNTKQSLPTENQVQISEAAVNINTASVAELEKLPHVGRQTALEIIEHREKFGKFRKPEHLLLVRKISDGRFREMRNLVRVE